MSSAKRLARVETSLTPMQAVLLWLKEVQQLDPDEYRKKTVKGPLHEAPLVRIPEMAEKAVHDSLSKKGMKPESVSVAALEAWKEADFLVVLVHQLNEEATLDDLQSSPNVKLLLLELGWMEEKHEEHGIFTAWGGWRALLIETLARMLLLRATIEAVSEQYYDNHAVLFSDRETRLNLGIQCAEDLAISTTFSKGRCPPGPRSILLLCGLQSKRRCRLRPGSK